jgi:hypothetical protein
VQIEPACGERGQEVSDGRPGAEADRHAVLDQQRGGLRGGLLLTFWVNQVTVTLQASEGRFLSRNVVGRHGT